jgi:protein-arginine kinase activator protein McsA
MTARVEQLESKKQKAVMDEDYETAKKLKQQIELLIN